MRKTEENPLEKYTLEQLKDMASAISPSYAGKAMGEMNRRFFSEARNKALLSKKGSKKKSFLSIFKKS